MRALRCGVAGSTLLLAWIGLAGCKISQDAVAASEQMTHTAADLRLYYGALAETVTRTIDLYEVDAALSKIPYGAEDRKVQEDTRAEILKRKKMAEELEKLAGSMRKLTRLKASDDVGKAATALGTELVSAQALPSGSPVPDVMGKAGQLLLRVAQEGDEKRAAQAMDKTLAAMAELFAKEKPVYDSLERTRLKEASQIAQDLMKADEVDVGTMLGPALKPFDMAPMAANPALQGSLRQLAKDRLQAKVEEGTRREIEASDAMLAALNEMSARVHRLATEKRVDLGGEPFSLKLVEQWVATVS